MAGFSLIAAAKASLAEDASAVTATADAKVELGPPPSDFGLKNDYYADAARVIRNILFYCVPFLRISAQVVSHMRYAVQLEKGNPVLAEVTNFIINGLCDQYLVISVITI